ncbi:MAG: YaeQ family protein [Oceanococcus sp.]
MAIKPTIYKFKIDLADINRSHYDSLELTVAQHPSETVERMMVRLLAYCLNAQEDLIFGRGVSSADEPDIWRKSLDGEIQLWIEVGEPSTDRARKASTLARQVQVCCFNTKSDVWWQQSEERLSKLNVSVIRFDNDGVRQLARLVKRSLSASVTISGESIFVATEDGDCEVSWVWLQPPS